MFLDGYGKLYHETRYTVSPPAPAITEPDKAAGVDQKGDTHVPDGARPDGAALVADSTGDPGLQRLGLG